MRFFRIGSRVGFVFRLLSSITRHFFIDKMTSDDPVVLPDSHGFQKMFERILKISVPKIIALKTPIEELDRTSIEKYIAMDKSCKIQLWIDNTFVTHDNRTLLSMEEIRAACDSIEKDESSPERGAHKAEIRIEFYDLTPEKQRDHVMDRELAKICTLYSYPSNGAKWTDDMLNYYDMDEYLKLRGNWYGSKDAECID